MPHDDRNMLEVLRDELNFVTKGGYRRSPRDPWRATLALEDSPTCMNYDSKANPAACGECLLMQFVPADKLGEKVPCRHIPITPRGETLLQLYRGATEEQIDEALTNWLNREIAKLENEELAAAPSV